MNDEEVGSFKFWKSKYRRGNLIIQTFRWFGFSEEIRCPFLNLREFLIEKSTAESCRMHWKLIMTKNLAPSSSLNQNTESGSK